MAGPLATPTNYQPMRAEAGERPLLPCLPLLVGKLGSRQSPLKPPLCTTRACDLIALLDYQLSDLADLHGRTAATA